MSTPERIGYLEQTCDLEEYLLKPMNCPHHIQIYAAQPRSYRELPVRLAEFGTVYRYEQSGELSGLTRVRGFTQDDAHLFCTHDQVRGEFRSTMEMTQFFLNSCLGLSDYRVRLSKSDPDDPKYQGAAGDIWRRAEDDIRSVLEEMGLPYEEAPGEAAFYGPKADFIVRDCIGRPVAARHGPARLRVARAVRPGIHRAGQPAAPAGDDPPRPAGEHGAVHGHLDRALRRCVSALAGARAGARAADLRQGRRLLAAGAGSAAGEGLPGRRSTSGPRRSGPRSATPSSRRSRPCSSSAPRKRRTRRSRTATGSTAIRGRCRWTRPWHGSRPSETAGEAARPRRLRLPRRSRKRARINVLIEIGASRTSG